MSGFREKMNRSREAIHGKVSSSLNLHRLADTQDIDSEFKGPVKASFVVGTNCGFLVFHFGRLKRLLAGPVYEISGRGEFYYALQRLGKSSRILKFFLVLGSDQSYGIRDH